VSSTNCITFLTPLEPTSIPSSNFFLVASLTRSVILSTTIKNKKDVIRSPCLNTLLSLNSKMGLSLTNIVTAVDSKQVLIHLIHVLLKSIDSTCKIKTFNLPNHKLSQNLIHHTSFSFSYILLQLSPKYYPIL